MNEVRVGYQSQRKRYAHQGTETKDDFALFEITQCSRINASGIKYASFLVVETRLTYNIIKTSHT